MSKIDSYLALLSLCFAMAFTPTQVRSESSSNYHNACRSHWIPDKLYWPGQTINFNQKIYRARWWSENKSPDQYSGPWNIWKKLPFVCPDLDELVESRRIMTHLRAFQAIADESDGNRAAATRGHERSLDYISEKLQDNFVLTKQEFSYQSWTETEPPHLARSLPEPFEYVHDVDFATMRWSGSGSPEPSSIQAIAIQLPPGEEPNSSASGCEAGDFYNENGDSLVTGKIALIQRGSCSFRLKAENAAIAGAVGALIFNEGQENRQGVVRGTLSEDYQGHIPVSGLSFAKGAELVSLIEEHPELKVTFQVQGQASTYTTSNLFAETREGDPEKTIMIGSHLDSVPEGPGINDNGSGSASLLEMAIQLEGFLPTLKNRVRFSWWSAEESGLIGSTHYVENLSEEQWQAINMYINLDMVASPNFGRFIYDSENIPEGSRQIRDKL